MDSFRPLLLIVFTEFSQLILSFHSRKFVAPLFGILRSFGVFILAKCCGLFKKFIHIFYGVWILASLLVIGFFV